MAAVSFRTICQKVLEDPLAHLPRSTMTPYERGDPIYRFVDRPKAVFLVIRGKVLVYLLAQNDRRFLLDIYAPDDFFGLSVLLPSPTVPEQAVAMEKCQVMAWNVAQIEQFENERPQLGLALVQMLARRSYEHARILANVPFDCLRPRLIRALLRFSQRFGSQTLDEWVRLPAITHEMLSEHIGTHRETISHSMNTFRRAGLVRYSRKEILIDPAAMQRWLSRQSAG